MGMSLIYALFSLSCSSVGGKLKATQQKCKVVTKISSFAAKLYQSCNVLLLSVPVPLERDCFIGRELHN